MDVQKLSKGELKHYRFKDNLLRYWHKNAESGHTEKTWPKSDVKEDETELAEEVGPGKGYWQKFTYESGEWRPVPISGGGE
jgi:hypothetical protein